MKKTYLFAGAVALFAGVALSSCSHDFDDEGSADVDPVVEKYNRIFIETFGQPAANQDWGFGESAQSRMTRSGNTSGNYTSYNATHTYTDANGKVIAGANMNHNEWADPNKEYGGWVVPDPLTEGQKLRVQKYFQANPNLSYQDPHYANFFVQQVYTGGTSAPETGNKEATAGADGQTHKGMTLNQLTVGQACSHINDFNAGTCSPSSVLDNGKTVNNGTYHSDQITLMVNVDDTSCFGYHETSGSNTSTNNQHNDKMALVSAAVIDAWAAANGNPGDPVVDKWNRSFMGFDYELLPESDIILDSYALLSQVPNLNNIPYAWDGTKVMTIGAVPANTETTKNDDFDLFPYFAAHASGTTNEHGIATCTNENGKISCYFPQYSAVTFGQGNQDWSPYSKLVIEFEASPINGTIMNTPFSVGDTKVEVTLNNEQWYGDNSGPVISTYDGSTGTLNITSVKLIGKTIEGQTYNASDYYNPTYLLGDGDADKIAFYSRNTNMYGGTVINLTENEMKTTQDGKTCLNLVKFQQLKTDGYHPITTDLKTWAKWQAACDHYYSDWIVTLTKAERIDEPEQPEQPEEPDTWGEWKRIICEDLSVNQASDFDFNDVVFDVRLNTAHTKAQVKFLAAGGTLPLTVGWDGQGTNWNDYEVHNIFGVSTGTMVNTNWKTGVTKDYVTKTFTGSFSTYNDVKIMVLKGENWEVITAHTGWPASKILVNTTYQWCDEREDIGIKYNSVTSGCPKSFRDYVKDPSVKSDWYEKSGSQPYY